MNFDEEHRRFKRTARTIGVGAILATIVMVAVLFGILFTIFHVVGKVQEKGLKNVVERVWEGPDK